MLLRHQAAIVLIAGIALFTALGGPRLWDDDEAKNARCAQEMLRRDDWIVPTFNFRLRPDKPALFYWLAMISYEMFGVSEFAARLPSALLAVGTSLATYHLGRRLFRPEVGLWAGLAMATSWMFVVAGRSATPDSTLIFCTTAALLAYVVAATCKPPNAPRSWPWFAAMYAAMGLAVLAKGPVGVVLPLAAIGGFAWFERSRSRRPHDRPTRPEIADLGRQLPYCAKLLLWHLRRLAAELPATIVAMRPLTCIVAVSAVALPWYACVAIRTHGTWWHEFFWNHNVERFLEPREGHRGWLLFPPLTLMACFFPWSLFLPAALVAAIRRIRREAADSAAVRLMLWWSAAWIIFFSICGTKQTNYILPAYPALAMLVGRWIADWIAASRQSAAASWSSRLWVSMDRFGDGRLIRVAEFVRIPRRCGVRPDSHESGYGADCRISASELVSVLPASSKARQPRRLTVVWAALAVTGAGVSAAIVVGAHWFPEAGAFWWAGLIPAGGAAAGWISEQRRRPWLAMACMAGSTATLIASLFGGLALPLSREQNGVRVAEFVRQLPEQPAKLGQFRLAFVGLVYYADRKVEELGTAEEAAALFSGGQNSLVATDPEGFAQLAALRPGELAIVGRRPRFGRPGDMVFVARSPHAEIARKQSTSIGMK